MKNFVSQQANAKALQQNDLQNTLQGNALEGQRTSQDTLQSEQQLAQQADRTQQDQGEQFDQTRIDQAKQLAGAGLTTSGLGQQQALQAETARNIQESRQAADTQQQIGHQELLKARTFQDIGRSNKLANFNFSNFVQSQGLQLKSEKLSEAKSKKADILSEADRVNQLKINKFISHISDPAKRQAARAAYG